MTSELWTYLFASVFLLGSVILARSMNERAMRKLPAEQKADLVDLFSKDRQWYFVFIIAIVVVYSVISGLQWLNEVYSFALLGLAVFTLVFSSVFRSRKKLKAHGFDEDYLNAFTRSGSVRLAGFVLALIALLIGL